MTWFEKIAASRKPDFIIGNDYCRRWWIIPRNKFFNIYLHHFLHSDDDRALHDHPWFNCSYLLQGEYTEWTFDFSFTGKPTQLHHWDTAEAAGIPLYKKAVVKAGTLRFRRAKMAHRVELHNGPCWSLFITGPVIRDWGFHCPKGWRIWKEFVDERDHGSVGRGCD